MPVGKSRQKNSSEVVSMTQSQAPQSFLDRDTSFEGKIAFNGNIQIDGQFKGEVRSDGTLVIGEGAQVDASVNVSNAIIHGEFKGEITATELIEIGPSSRVAGELRTTNIQIAKGALVNAQIEMQPAGDSGVITLPTETREESIAD